jgi:hypothetical protein
MGVAPLTGTDNWTHYRYRLGEPVNAADAGVHHGTARSHDRRNTMPDQATIKRAQRDAREGKAPTTQAGEFVREEIHHIREGKHGARSAKQAVAIGLSEARKAGVDLPPPPGNKSSPKKKSATKRSAKQSAAKIAKKPVSPKRSRATLDALKKEPRSSASHAALARQAHNSAAMRTPKQRHDAAMKAVKTKGSAVRKQAAKKAARTRAATH